MGLYTFLYENLLYTLYFIRIQPPRIVTARLSRYTASLCGDPALQLRRPHHRHPRRSACCSTSCSALAPRSRLLLDLLLIPLLLLPLISLLLYEPGGEDAACMSSSRVA